MAACVFLWCTWCNPLRWRHNDGDSVSNHQPHDCLLSRLFGRTSKKTSKLRVTGLCAGNSPWSGEFPAQMASNAENVSIWWRHHAISVRQQKRSGDSTCAIISSINSNKRINVHEFNDIVPYLCSYAYLSISNTFLYWFIHPSQSKTVHHFIFIFIYWRTALQLRSYHIQTHTPNEHSV